MMLQRNGSVNFRSKLGILYLIVFGVICSLVYPTYGWFVNSIQSRGYDIRTTAINLRVNGSINNFEIDFSGGPYWPGSYIGGDSGFVTYEIINETSTPVLYTSGFVYGSGDRTILEGMIVERLEREIYNAGGTLKKRDIVIDNYRIQGKYAYLNNYIDTLRVNGSGGRDGKISLAEFEHIQNKCVGAFKGYTLGMLKPSCKEILKYKIKFDDSATGSRYEDKNLNFAYKFYSGQRNLDVFKQITRDNVVDVGREVNQGFFDYVLNLRYGEIENAYYNIQ